MEALAPGKPPDHRDCRNVIHPFVIIIVKSAGIGTFDDPRTNSRFREGSDDPFAL